jgi:hypothetical protein
MCRQANPSPARQRPGALSARRRPRLEALEGRLAPAAYHVTSLLDDGGAGTLRAAGAGAEAPIEPPLAAGQR